MSHSMGIGYYYGRGRIVRLDSNCVHSDVIGSVTDAISQGIVRIRDHGHIVAFQGKNKNLVFAAIKKFCRDIRIPAKIAKEWPGHYSET